MSSKKKHNSIKKTSIHNYWAIFVMNLQHGHSFCTPCLSEWVEMNHTCPIEGIDGQLLTKAQFVPNLAIRSILDQHEVRCVHVKVGCDWTGRLDALQEHLKSECMASPK